MNNRNKIDDLFRESMTGYKEEPSLSLWFRIERHFFPPSKFRPSGLISSVLLLTVAGLMPWVLIPANDKDEKQPNLPGKEMAKRGFLIQAKTPSNLHKEALLQIDPNGKPFASKPSLFLSDTENPAADPGSQLLASIYDPSEDPAIQPLLQAYRREYMLAAEPEPVSVAYSAVHWIYRMRSYSAGAVKEFNISEDIDRNTANLPKSAFTPDYENDYFKTGELSAGLNFNPSIIFYNPNPYNKILGGEAVIHYKLSSFSIMTGLGFSRMEDVGSYRVDYISQDSVGYYLRVISFIPDPRNPGNVTYVVTREPIYDSVEHYVIEDKTNYYSYLDIPLSFGYNILQKGRISLTASAGVKFSLLVAKNEPQVDFWISDAELIDIERQIPARTLTNWRFTAGIDFGYLFSEKFSIHLEPVFEQYISPIYKEQAGYAPSKPYVIGVKAGIRYYF